jgi:uncharacterized protein (TIGR03067 family)
MLIRDDLCRTYLPNGTFRDDEIRLDPAGRPKEIHFRQHVQGGLQDPVPAIYDLAGDRLRICIQAETNPNSPRPSEFAAGATAHLREFVREPIAWGEPVEGLRLGVAVSPASARVGDTVTVRLYATTGGDDNAITFESPDLNLSHPFCRPVFRDQAGQAAKLSMLLIKGFTPPLRHVRYALVPQGVVEIGSTEWVLHTPDPPPVGQSVAVVPGAYTVRFEKFETKGRPRADTGTATLTVADQR